MDDRIVPNLSRILEEFLERAARSCAYAAGEFLREQLSEQKLTLKRINEFLDQGIPDYKTETLAAKLEENIRDVFYELFEIQRAEDASDPTNDVISRSLFGIQRAMEQIERRLCERRSVVDNRGVEE